MSHFAESLHPDDVPDWHKGIWDGETEPDDEEIGEDDDENERTD